MELESALTQAVSESGMKVSSHREGVSEAGYRGGRIPLPNQFEQRD